MQTLRRFGALLVGIALGSGPRLAAACSVCTAGREEESQVAFLATTVFMSALPLILIGGVAWGVARRLHHREPRRLTSPRATRRALQASR